MKFPEIIPGLPPDFPFPEDFQKKIQYPEDCFWGEWENWMIVYFEEYEDLDYGESRSYLYREGFDKETGTGLEELSKRVRSETIFFHYKEYAEMLKSAVRKDFRDLVMETIRARN